MDSLIDSMNNEQWCEKKPSEIEGFVEFQIMRQHAQVNDNTIRYLIQTNPDADPVAATCTGILKGKDPIKNIGTCEMKVDADGCVLAINLDGDCVAKI